MPQSLGESMRVWRGGAALQLTTCCTTLYINASACLPQLFALVSVPQNITSLQLYGLYAMLQLGMNVLAHITRHSPAVEALSETINYSIVCASISICGWYRALA